jgi:hypothetical protein
MQTSDPHHQHLDDASGGLERTHLKNYFVRRHLGDGRFVLVEAASGATTQIEVDPKDRKMMDLLHGHCEGRIGGHHVILGQVGPKTRTSRNGEVTEDENGATVLTVAHDRTPAAQSNRRRLVKGDKVYGSWGLELDREVERFTGFRTMQLFGNHLDDLAADPGLWKELDRDARARLESLNLGGVDVERLAPRNIDELLAGASVSESGATMRGVRHDALEPTPDFGNWKGLVEGNGLPGDHMKASAMAWAYQQALVEQFARKCGNWEHSGASMSTAGFAQLELTEAQVLPFGDPTRGPKAKQVYSMELARRVGAETLAGLQDSLGAKPEAGAYDRVSHGGVHDEILARLPGDFSTRSFAERRELYLAASDQVAQKFAGGAVSRVHHEWIKSRDPRVFAEEQKAEAAGEDGINWKKLGMAAGKRLGKQIMSGHSHLSNSLSDVEGVSMV